VFINENHLLLDINIDIYGTLTSSILCPAENVLSNTFPFVKLLSLVLAGPSWFNVEKFYDFVYIIVVLDT
jgi:hypothetical protein